MTLIHQGISRSLQAFEKKKKNPKTLVNNRNKGKQGKKSISLLVETVYWLTKGKSEGHTPQNPNQARWDPGILIAANETYFLIDTSSAFAV